MLNLDSDKDFQVDEALSHIAFIMDGNGRWAKKQGKPREYGHTFGVKAFERVVLYCRDIGIRHVTVYAFSTENWKRPKTEVDAIMKIFGDYLGRAKKKADEYLCHVVFLGDKSVFPQATVDKMCALERDTADHPLTLNIAVNYGGRDEIVHAVNKALECGAEHITAEDISTNLYTSGGPDPDLIVRTGDEVRLSNFLLWQAAYAELYFTPTLWPDMGEEDIRAAVRAFYKRKRRYGGV